MNTEGVSLVDELVFGRLASQTTALGSWLRGESA
jgi:hypothetical protein